MNNVNEIMLMNNDNSAKHTNHGEYANNAH